MTTAIFRLEAMSLALPHVPGHPNRMPFSGTLTRVGLASDAAPGGSGGKRVLITPDAAERALPSLMGMAVNLTTAMDGHAPTAKIGFIHSAKVVGTELEIEGFIYAADFPQEALRVHLEQSQLGFSFEARNISATDAEADPVVINDLFFTGAAILMKNKAAYKTTRLAALAAMKHESDDDMDAEAIKAAMTEVIAGAIAPVSQQITDLVAKQSALENRVAGFSSHLEAQQARMAKIEPAAASLEKTAQAMETAGATEQAQAFRQMAASMRLDAAAGREPQPFVPATHGVSLKQVEPPKFEDSDGYKTLQAQLTSMTASLAVAVDKVAAAETKMSDLKAAADLAKLPPERKTLPPMIANLVAKAGVEMPGEGDGPMNVGKLNQVLAGSGLTTDQRMTLKTGLAKAGIINLNTTAQ